MPKGDDIIGLLSGGVNGCLDSSVEGSAVLAAGDGVNIVAIFVHEVLGGGLGDGLGGGDTHQSHLLAAHLKNLVGFQHRLILIEEVAGQVGILGPLDDVHGTGHGIVELMVAQSCGIIPGGVHQVDDGVALILGAEGSALNMVAGIHQQHILQSGLIPGDGGIPQGRDLSGLLPLAHGLGIVNVGVGIVGVQDHDLAVFGLGLLGSHSRGSQSQAHDQSQRQGQELFALLHRSSPFLLCFFGANRLFQHL